MCTELPDPKSSIPNVTSMQLFKHGHSSFMPTSVFTAFKEFILFDNIFPDLEVYQGWRQESWVLRSDINLSVTTQEEQEFTINLILICSISHNF